MSDTFSGGPDVVLIGAGIMSATLGVFLKELEPSSYHRNVRNARGGSA